MAQAPDVKEQLAADMDDLFFVIQLFSYPGDYVAERPTIERIAETLDKFEEDVLRADYPGIRGTRQGRACGLASRFLCRKSARPRGAWRQWTDLVESRVQGLLDEINAAAALRPELNSQCWNSSTLRNRLAALQVLKPTTLRLERGADDGSDWAERLREIDAVADHDRADRAGSGAGAVSTASRSRRQNVMLVRRKIGYVIQDGGLFPHLSARGQRGAAGEVSGLGEAAGCSPRLGNWPS